MTLRRVAPWLAGWLLSMTCVSAVRAQMLDAFCDGCCDHDMQLFAPVDFDYNCLPIRDQCGFFFNYSRLAWTATGERTTIGAKGMTVPSEIIYRQNPFDNGIAPQPYTIQNGIQDAPPDADFGFGHRYEIGYFKGGNSWMVGVLDGPRVTSQEIYGFQQIVIPNTLPLVSQGTNGTTQLSYLNLGPGLPPLLVGGPRPLLNTPIDIGGGAGSADLSTARYGFGSVHVNFETPPDFLLGWRDYNPVTEDGIPLPNTNGPGRILTVTGTLAVIEQGQVTAIRITGADVTQISDGIIDNLNGDPFPGFFLAFIDVDGSGDFNDGDILLGYGVDYEDLHTFNIRFNTLAVRNTTETNGVEIMRAHELDNSHLPVKEQRNRFTIGYGVRFFELDDAFTWDGDMDTLGRTYQSTQAVNQIVGPQIRAQWLHQKGRLSFAMDGRCLFGYNITDLKQRGLLFEDALPGGLNRPVNVQPTAVAYGRRENEFSPMAELRAEARYQITGAFAARLGYTGIFVDNITRASQIVRYSLPDLGMHQGGHQEIFINGVDVGIEAVY